MRPFALRALLALPFALSLTTATTRADIQFDAPFRTNDAATAPRGVAVADFDGDGRPDVVTPNSPTGGNAVALNRGRGDGSFDPLVNWASGLRPQSVAAGDVNGDGRPDIVTANLLAPGISLLINAGGGTFPAHLDYATTATSLSQTLAIADFDGDGRGDVIVQNGSDPTLSIFPGRADGTLGARIDLANTRLVLAADVNGDGRSDLVSRTRVVNDDIYTVRLNTGGFTFGAPINVALGIHSPQTLNFGDAGDFNEDGKLDLVYEVLVTSQTSEIGFVPGNGDGTFGAATLTPSDGSPRRLGVGDIDGDGHRDVVIGHADVSTDEGGYYSVHRGLGNGTFTVSRQFACIGNPFGLVVADVNGDGRADVVSQSNHGCAVGASLAQPSGDLGVQHRYTVGGELGDIAVGDVNGDGFPDVVASNEDSLAVLLNDGNGNLPILAKQAATDFYTPQLADFNDDGVLDLAARGSDVVVRLGVGNGTFGPETVLGVGGTPMDLRVADANHDGKPDLIVQTSSAILALLGNGNGTFAAPLSSPYPAGTSVIACGNLIGDAFPDLVLGSSSNGLILHGVGDGTFVAGPSLPFGTMENASLGDVDEDGIADIVFTYRGSNNDLAVLRGQADGSFVLGQDVPLVGIFGQEAAFLADFDHDGHLDVGTLSIHGGMAVWRGDGHANFTHGPVDFGLGDLPYYSVAADMNGDDLPDLVSSNSLLSDVSVVMNRTPVVLAVPSAGPIHVAGLSIAGTAPNPSRGERLAVAFSLPGRGAARLEAFDPAGRRVAVREMGSLEAGSHRTVLTGSRRFAPGLYLLRLTQAGKTASGRAVVIE